MNCYTIFDDFDLRATQIIRDAGIMLDIHPQGVPRPDASQMKRILEQYDAVIIGTTQKITEDMFDGITAPRIIATASVGLDHIRIPEDKILVCFLSNLCIHQSYASMISPFSYISIFCAALSRISLQYAASFMPSSKSFRESSSEVACLLMSDAAL